MSFTYRNILIDSNNLFHRNYEKLKDMTYQVKGNTLITGGIYGSMRSAWKLEREYLENHPESRIYFLFDNAKSKENMRRGVDPSYKINRKSMSKSFYRSLDYFRFLLLNSSNTYTCVYGTGYESDDIAPVIINELSDNSLVVSEDMDWSRLIGWRGKEVHHLMKGKVFDKAAFNREFDFEPSEDKVVMYKTLRGDSIDNIPVGIRGMREKDVLSVVEGYRNIYELLNDLEYAELTNTMKNKIRESSARLKLNYQLVSFLPLEHGDIQNCIFQGKYNPYVLSTVYDSLGFDVEHFDKRVYDYKISRRQEPEDDFFIGSTIKHI